MVRSLNERGAGLSIGAPLHSAGGVRTFAIEPSGSIAAYQDEESGLAAVGHCRRSELASGEVHCYRAANVVLILGEEASAAEQARLRRSLLRLAGGDPSAPVSDRPSR